jgi:HD-like signal output (HDOD) protein
MENRATSTDFLLQNLDSLPTLPTVVYELTELINDPMSSTTEIEKIMVNDQALTTRILRLVNSAYYAIPGGVTTVSRAIAYLGFDTVNQLVLGSAIMDSLQCEGAEDFDLNQFWQHSIGVSMGAETIAKYVRLQKQSDVFTAGLVHDMGKIALAQIAPQNLVDACAYAKSFSTSLEEAERQTGCPLHTEIGGLLAKKWKLPSAIEACVKHHHTFEPLKRGGLSAENNKLVDIITLSNLLMHALKFGNSGHNKVEGAPKALLDRLGIPADQVKTLVGKIKDSLSNADSFLKILNKNE